MNKQQQFFQYLASKGKKTAYIDSCEELLTDLQNKLVQKAPTSATIDEFVRSRWSGYVSKDRDTYRILNDYSGFCEVEWPIFSDAFRQHISDTFEGEARKAMRTYKNSLVYIPKNTKIDDCFLGNLTNEEFIETFRTLQNLLYDIYDEIEHGSPFSWGWPDWNGLTSEGLNQNRVMMFLAALADNGHMDGDILVVDKKCFNLHSICKPMVKSKLILRRFVEKGFHIKYLEDKESSVFTVSYPGTPNLMTVLFAYFKNHQNTQNHIRVFSYRFVENPVEQSRGAFFMAKTDGEPEKLHKMYYWLYDEAVKHGYKPMDTENMGCFVYKKGSREWLLLGSGSSYHEDEFLHSVKYALAVKVRFHRVFETHPDKINSLRKKFPDTFGRPWTQCFRCKTNHEDCKNRVLFEKDGHDYYHCGTKHHLYFHDPDLDDLKLILELFKLENNISPSSDILNDVL